MKAIQPFHYHKLLFYKQKEINNIFYLALYFLEPPGLGDQLQVIKKHGFKRTDTGACLVVPNSFCITPANEDDSGTDFYILCVRFATPYCK